MRWSGRTFIAAWPRCASASEWGSRRSSSDRARVGTQSLGQRVPGSKSEHCERQLYGKKAKILPCRALRWISMDLYQLIVFAVFEGIVGGVALVLSLTYVGFARMEKNIRRARMFIMADRI